MKASTPELMKFQRLMRRLKESRRGVIGLLEGMWMATAKNCPRGDIGRFSNEEIAVMVDWDGDPDLLIEALVETGWLDACSVERLVIHDWDDHCPTYIKGGLSTKGLKIAIAIPYSPGLEPQAKATGLEMVSSYSDLSFSSQTKSETPPPAKPPKDKKPKDKYDISTQEYPPHLDNPEFRSAWAEWVGDLQARYRLTPRAGKAQFRSLAEMNDSAAAIRCIHEALGAQWKSVFPKPSHFRSIVQPQSPQPAPPREKTQAEKDAILAQIRAQRAMEDAKRGA